MSLLHNPIIDTDLIDTLNRLFLALSSHKVVKGIALLVVKRYRLYLLLHIFRRSTLPPTN